MNFIKNDKDGLVKSIFTAYAILLLHLLLLAGAGVAVVLFKGVYQYLPWIMGFIGLAVLAVAFLYYRRLSRSSSDISRFFSMPGLEDRTIDVKLLGGIASFKISPRENGQTRLEQKPVISPAGLIDETISDATEQKILKLAALLEKDLITKEEFETAKQKILQG